MKCPLCGEEVKPGTFFCPKCLSEIQWVPEYNTVETQIRRKRKEDRHFQKHKSQMKRKFSGKNGLKILLCCAVFLILGTLFLGGMRIYQMNTYAYQYKTGVKAYEQGDYEKAVKHMDAALLMEPDNPNANVMLASIFEAQGDYTSVEKILTVFLKQHPDNQEAYGILLRAMEKNGDTQEIKQLMRTCTNPDILEEYAEYVCPNPQTSLRSGTYPYESAQIALKGDCVKIYYSLDGTKPNEHSPVYEKPIQIRKGVTILYAYGVNEKGISSDVIYRRYILQPGEDED